jgi:hypothetical protein
MHGDPVVQAGASHTLFAGVHLNSLLQLHPFSLCNLLCMICSLNFLLAFQHHPLSLLLPVLCVFSTAFQGSHVHTLQLILQLCVLLPGYLQLPRCCSREPRMAAVYKMA